MTAPVLNAPTVLARLALLTAAGLALAACAPADPVVEASPTPTPTEAAPSPSPSVTPSAEPSPVVTVTEAAPLDPWDGSAWLITFTGIGPFNISQTFAEQTALTGVSYAEDLETFDGYCASWQLGEDSTLSYMYSLAESDGAYGLVDSISVAAWEEAVGAFPATLDGLTIGSTKAEVLAAYPRASVEEYLYNEEWERIKVEQNGNGMLFLVNDLDVVMSITVGRVPQYAYVEGCA